MDSLLFEANLQGASASEALKGGFSQGQLLSAINRARAAAKRALYNYAPVDYAAISALSAKSASGVKDIPSLASAVSQLKPSQLEALLLPFVTDGRPQEFLIQKKCDSAVHIAISCYLSGLFQKLYPLPAAAPSGKPAAPGFRFAACYGKWVLVRKATPHAERKEVFACLVATAETLDRKAVEFTAGGPEFLASLGAFLDARPSRRSLGKIPILLKNLASSGMLSGPNAQFAEFAAAKAMSHCGYSPYCSIELVNGVYPELKIPKPRGRQKKA